MKRMNTRHTLLSAALLIPAIASAQKTNPEKIAKGFAKIGYEATVVTEEAKKAGRGGCDKKK